MLYRFLKYSDDFLNARTKREFYLILIAIICGIFCAIYLWVIPPVSEFLSQKLSTYEQTKFILSQSKQQLKKLSFKNTQEDMLDKAQILQKNLFVFKEVSKTDYDVLSIITRLTEELKLEIISDVLLEDKNISFTLSGSFEDVVEFIRRIEEYHFVFIEDFDLKSSGERIDCTLHLVNLGTSLWNF